MALGRNQYQGFDGRTIRWKNHRAKGWKPSSHRVIEFSWGLVVFLNGTPAYSSIMFHNNSLRKLKKPQFSLGISPSATFDCQSVCETLFFVSKKQEMFFVSNENRTNPNGQQELDQNEKRWKVTPIEPDNLRMIVCEGHTFKTGLVMMQCIPSLVQHVLRSKTSFDVPIDLSYWCLVGNEGMIHSNNNYFYS